MADALRSVSFLRGHERSDEWSLSPERHLDVGSATQIEPGKIVRRHLVHRNVARSGGDRQNLRFRARQQIEQRQ